MEEESKTTSQRNNWRKSYEAMVSQFQTLQTEYQNCLTELNELKEKRKKRNDTLKNYNKQNPAALRLAQRRYYYKQRIAAGKEIHLTEEELKELFGSSDTMSNTSNSN